jgi:hypothetical protein
MAIARQMKWSLGEVIYGKKAMYDNDKGISDFERNLWFALWEIEADEREEAEAERKRVQARKEREAARNKGG